MEEEIKKQKCDYCIDDAEYEQTLEWVNIETRIKECIHRFACGEHKDYFEN